MALENAVQGAQHTGQEIIWTRSDGTAQGLPGATLTGRVTPVMSPATEAWEIDGELEIGDADGGMFTWSYGEDDVANWGVFLVQFKATYDDDYDLSFSTEWTVEKAI